MEIASEASRVEGSRRTVRCRRVAWIAFKGGAPLAALVREVLGAVLRPVSAALVF
jgi:hypothetical protein